MFGAMPEQRLLHGTPLFPVLREFFFDESDLKTIGGGCGAILCAQGGQSTGQFRCAIGPKRKLIYEREPLLTGVTHIGDL
jgi:hypothetical protein